MTEGLRGQFLGEFWDRLAGGALSLQLCASCAYVRYPPGPTCPNCGSPDAQWTDLVGPATVAAWTVTHPAAADRLPSRLRSQVPYILALLRFPQLPAYYLPVRLEAELEAVTVGVEVRVEADADQPRRLIARPVNA
jgi:uncharacterized OB-fold protein